MIRLSKATLTPERLDAYNLPPAQQSRVRQARTASMEKIATQPVAKLEPDYAYHHVIGLHGDQKNEDGDFVGNDNGDFFWWRQTLLAKRDDDLYAYQTWIGGDVLENHDERQIRGHIADVWPIFGDKSIDMLMATNKRVHSLLVTNIDKAKITDVSMGTIVGHSYCSVPGCKRHANNNEPNITEEDWCHHLRYYKGSKDPVSGHHVYEDNRDIFGVECSWITIGAGADSGAKMQMKVAAITEQQMHGSRIMNASVVSLFARNRH